MATSDDLWGGQLTSVQFDPVSHTCNLQVTVVNDRTSSYSVDCEEVTDLRFRNAIPLPWAYADVTEAHVDVDEQSSQHVLELMLWSEGSALVVWCSSIQIRETP